MSRLVRAMRPELLLSPLPFVVVTLLGGVALFACGEDEVPRGAGSADRASSVADSAEGGGKAKAGKAANKAPAKAEQAGDLPEVDEWVVPLSDTELPEAVFVETDENRDPFRSYLLVFTAQALPEEDITIRPPVLLEDVSLDELRLIAVVSGDGGSPRAMVTDPEGKGWVVRRGDYLGRGEKIRIGPGQPEREINWRIVRVRPDRIILVREDPIQAGPPVTRVMRLYPEEGE
jgi:type IV pilus assembly protein PilP